MKKILMGTTALVALTAFSSQAAAENISLGLGGFQQAYIGKISRAEEADTNMDIGGYTDTEIYFSGSTTLDNGLTISTTVQLEADGRGSLDSHTHGTTHPTKGTSNTAAASSTGIDASYMTISSDAMGALTIGATNGAGDQMGVGAPGIGDASFGGSSVGGWDRTFQGWQTNTLGVSDDKTIKGVYMSPDFNGVTIGMSYTPGEGYKGSTSGRSIPHGFSEDAFQAAVGFGGDMSGAAVSAALVYENNGAADVNTTGFGVEAAMSGMTFGGSYWDNNDSAVGSSANDGNGYDIGVAYETGAMSVAVTYSNATMGASGAKAKDKMTNLGVGYDLGSGVGIVASYYIAKSTTTAAVTQTTKGLIAGIEVGF